MRAVVPGGRGFCRHDGWRAVIGVGLGAGIGSLAYLARLITGVPAIAIELLAALGLGWFAWRGRTCDLCSTPREAWSVLDRYLAGVLAMAIAAAMVLFVRQTALNPHGQWDAWAIHNLHARFLYYPDAWRDLFTPLLTWNHPDY